MDRKKIYLAILTVVLIGSILTVFLLPPSVKAPTQNSTSPTPINSDPVVPEQVKTDFKNFLNETVLSSYIPKVLPLLIPNIKNPDGFKFYGAFWEDENKNSFLAGVEYDKTNRLIEAQVGVRPPKIVENLDPQSSMALFKEYFQISPLQPFTCTNLDSTHKLCKVFWIDTNQVKKAVSIESPVDDSNTARIYYCERHAQSPNYKLEECKPDYEDPGAIPNF